jgi:hypothetical protein
MSTTSAGAAGPASLGRLPLRGCPVASPAGVVLSAVLWSHVGRACCHGALRKPLIAHARRSGAGQQVTADPRLGVAGGSGCPARPQLVRRRLCGVCEASAESAGSSKKLYCWDCSRGFQTQAQHDRHMQEEHGVAPKVTAAKPMPRPAAQQPPSTSQKPQATPLYRPRSEPRRDPVARAGVPTGVGMGAATPAPTPPSAPAGAAGATAAHSEAQALESSSLESLGVPAASQGVGDGDAGEELRPPLQGAPATASRAEQAGASAVDPAATNTASVQQQAIAVPGGDGTGRPVVASAAVKSSPSAPSGPAVAQPAQAQPSAAQAALQPAAQSQEKAPGAVLDKGLLVRRCMHGRARRCLCSPWFGFRIRHRCF